MSRLELYFRGNENPELIKTGFEHPLLKAPRQAVRGRMPSGLSEAGTFQWTSAVRALSVLLLKSAAFQRGAEVNAVLEGNCGSLASSLDFSLTKLPNWHVDIFGLDGRGNPLVRRLIYRENIGLKRAGPVLLRLGGALSNDMTIVVYLDGNQINDKDVILRLALRIEESWQPHHSGVGRKPTLDIPTTLVQS